MATNTSDTFVYSSNLAFDDTDKTHQAFSGCDIVAYMGHKRVASLQGITVSIVCEVMPIYTFGNRGPRAFVKGKRAISGNLVFTQFDRHAVLKEAEALRNLSTQADLWNAQQSNISRPADAAAAAAVMGRGWNSWLSHVNSEIQDIYDAVGSRSLKFVDQIPPFDVTIGMVNDSGVASMAAVLGVQLVNEGYGWTLDDLTSEMAVTYIAKDVIPLTPLTAISKASASVAAAASPLV